MKIRSTSQSRTASALVAVIITIAVLALLASSLVVNVNNRRMTLSQASAWQEALAAAEAGVHQGIAHRAGLGPKTTTFGRADNKLSTIELGLTSVRLGPVTQVTLTHAGGSVAMPITLPE